MSAKKVITRLKKNLERQANAKKNTGGIKLLPTITHGDEAAVRCKNVPIFQSGNRIDLEQYEDWE